MLPTDDPGAVLGRLVESGDITMEELQSRYATMVYRRAGSYLEAGRRLGLDRRTVKRYVDEAKGSGNPRHVD